MAPALLSPPGQSPPGLAFQRNGSLSSCPQWVPQVRARGGEASPGHPEALCSMHPPPAESHTPPQAQVTSPTSSLASPGNVSLPPEGLHGGTRCIRLGFRLLGARLCDAIGVCRVARTSLYAVAFPGHCVHASYAGRATRREGAICGESELPK